MDDSLPKRRGLILLPAVALALGTAWHAGCSGFQGTTAASFLRKVRDDPDPNNRYLAYQKLASSQCYDSEEQKVEAVKTLVAKLEDGHEPVATRAVICQTLGELGNPAAREALIKAVGDTEGLVRSQACRALGKVGSPEDATILSRVMTVDTLEDCRIAAIEGLGEMKARDPRILEVLVVGMGHEDPAIRLTSLEALRRITGKDLGVDPAAWHKELQGDLASTAPPAPMQASTAPPASSR
jgi:HEAT repeat protein